MKAKMSCDSYEIGIVKKVSLEVKDSEYLCISRDSAQ